MAPGRSNAWKSWYLHGKNTMSHGALLLKNPEMAACFGVEAQALESDKPRIKSCYIFCSLCDWNQASHNIPEPHSSSVKRNSQSIYISPG